MVAFGASSSISITTNASEHGAWSTLSTAESESKSTFGASLSRAGKTASRADFAVGAGLIKIHSESSSDLAGFAGGAGRADITESVALFAFGLTGEEEAALASSADTWSRAVGTSVDSTADTVVVFVQDVSRVALGAGVRVGAVHASSRAGSASVSSIVEEAATWAACLTDGGGILSECSTEEESGGDNEDECFVHWFGIWYG